MDATVFLGRGGELRVVRDVFAAAAAGRSAVVWVEGAAGAGKSAFVRHVLGLAPEGSMVRRAAAEEVAHEVSFALVDQFGIGHSEHPFATGLALLELFASDGLSVVVVEDLHWADPLSRQALLTAARRLDEDAVVMFVTSRPGLSADDGDGWTRLLMDSPAVVRVALGPLTTGDVVELAGSVGLTLSPQRAIELHALTLGHALHVRTLLAELTPDAVLDTGTPLPVPPTLTATTVGRLGSMSDDGRRLSTGSPCSTRLRH